MLFNSTLRNQSSSFNTVNDIQDFNNGTASTKIGKQIYKEKFLYSLCKEDSLAASLNWKTNLYSDTKK